MKNRLLIGSALAASLVLTACSGSTSTPPTTATTSTTSVSESTESTEITESTDTTESSTTAEPTDLETTGSETGTVVPATLDDQSIAWFTTFCGSLTSIQESSASVGGLNLSPTTPPAEQQAALAAGVSDFGNKFKTAAADIGAMLPATITGGDQLAAGATTAFTKVGDSLIAAADTFASTSVTDLASLQSAGTALGSEIQASVTGIQESLAPLESVMTPELEAAVEQIPGCENIGSA